MGAEYGWALPLRSLYQWVVITTWLFGQEGDRLDGIRSFADIELQHVTEACQRIYGGRRTEVRREVLGHEGIRWRHSA